MPPKSIWKSRPEINNWLSLSGNLSLSALATHAMDSRTVAREFFISEDGRKMLRTQEDSIMEMLSIGGHLFYVNPGTVAILGWDTAIVQLNFADAPKGAYLSSASYHGMLDGPLKEFIELSQGWFGKKIRRRRVTPPTEMYMLARAQGNFGLINIGSEDAPFISGNYDPKVVEAFSFCKKGLLAKVPTGRLVLLDGPPGTGKTRFVRALMSSLHNAARVIVVPEHLTAMLADPDLIPVLKDSADYGEGPIILILEDADDCLKSRDDHDGRGTTQSLASLLNLSDGIVGAMLDLRIVATTNIRITKMDAAVMRPGRLLSRVEFGPLDVPQAAEVFARLTNGKGQPPTTPMTLAEVYAAATSLLGEGL